MALLVIMISLKLIITLSLLLTSFNSLRATIILTSTLGEIPEWVIPDKYAEYTANFSDPQGSVSTAINKFVIKSVSEDEIIIQGVITDQNGKQEFTYIYPQGLFFLYSNSNTEYLKKIHSDQFFSTS